MEDKKREIYEKLILGAIDADKFKLEKTGIDAELDRLKQAKVTFLKDAEKSAINECLHQTAKDAINARKLNKKLVDSFIEKILVYKDKRIEIIWKASGFDVAGTEVNNVTQSKKMLQK
jgi:hypothetical protein